MSEEKLNSTIDLPVELIEERIRHRLNGELPDYKTVVSPRALKFVRKLCIMQEESLKALIRGIPLRGTSVLPYAHSEIEVALTEPKNFRVGQRFVLERKLLGLMTDLPQRIFQGFCSGGFSSLPPAEIYGIDFNDREVIALYIPPVLEYIGSQKVLLDGIHRSFICRGVGAPLNAVHVYNPSEELPFTPTSWQECSNVSEKPGKENRYFNLNPKLFRDLTFVGIDG